MNQEIPKKIHFIWLGPNPMPAISERCINSWKTILPEYEIQIWNDWDVNLLGTEYKEIYDDEKTYAFKSDILRIVILYKIGGIYNDVDLEILKDIRPYIKDLNFFGVNYRFSNNYATTPLGSIPNHIICKEILEKMQKVHNTKINHWGFSWNNNPNYCWYYYIAEHVLSKHRPVQLGSISDFIPQPDDFFLHYAQHNRSEIK